MDKDGEARNIEGEKMEQIIKQFMMEIVMFFFLSLCVYSVVNMLSSLIKAFPDRWGKLAVDGFPKEVKRWLNAIFAYLFSWTLHFTVVSKIFVAYNKNGATISEHVNYLIVAALIFMGAQNIYRWVTMNKNIMEGKGKEK